MHRNESQARRSDREKDISRLREIERLRIAQLGLPVPPPKPEHLLEYEPADTRRKVRRLIGIINAAIDDCLGLTLLVALFAFFIGLIVPDARGGGLNLAMLLAGGVIVIGIFRIYLEVRRRLCRHPSNW
jgi:hypothetical protein